MYLLTDEGILCEDMSVLCDLFRKHIKDMEIEHLAVALLNKDMFLIKLFEFSSGDQDTVSCTYRNIINLAVKYSSKRIVLMHNHPNNSLTPSTGDKVSTKQAQNALLYHGIQLIDHLIITENGYASVLSEQ